MKNDTSKQVASDTYIARLVFMAGMGMQFNKYNLIVQKHVLEAEKANGLGKFTLYEDLTRPYSGAVTCYRNDFLKAVEFSRDNSIDDDLTINIDKLIFAQLNDLPLSSHLNDIGKSIKPKGYDAQTDVFFSIVDIEPHVKEAINRYGQRNQGLPSMGKVCGVLVKTEADKLRTRLAEAMGFRIAGNAGLSNKKLMSLIEHSVISEK